MNGKPGHENSTLRIFKYNKTSKLKTSGIVKKLSKDIKFMVKLIKLSLIMKRSSRDEAYDQFAALEEFKREFVESGGLLSDSPQKDIGMYCEALLVSSYYGLVPPIVVETKYAIGAYDLFYRVSKDVYNYLANGRVNGAIFIVHDSTGEVNFSELQADISKRFGEMFSVLIISSEQIMGTNINPQVNRLLLSFLNDVKGQGMTWYTGDFEEFYSDDRLTNFVQKLAKFNVTVFFGAGLSSSAGFPTWNNLIESSWWETARGRGKLENAGDEYVLSKIDEIIGDTPLIKARMLQESQGETLFWRLRDLLYPSEYETSPLIEESCNLIKSLKVLNKLGQVLTLNYDNLIEEGLMRLGIKMPALYGVDNTYDDSDYILHVHGYLPPPPQRLTQKEIQSIVFSESTYNLLASNSYAATNIRVLHRLINDSCIFIGHSMTDPNMRRLLEVSQSVRQGKRHIWFKRLPNIDRHDWDKYIFNRQIAILQEKIMGSLGIEVIWYKEHEDLPKLLRKVIEMLNGGLQPTPASS